MIRPLALLTLALATPAGAFDFAQPIACTLGTDCHVQNYFDRDPGAGTADVGCGNLTYNGHDGTDFALPSLAAMQAGVDVLAAAPGTVRGIRDGMPDIAISDPAAPPLDGRDCGNGVAIDHGDGWETQYCHMKQGSIRVRTGDRVETGQPLGLVGLSGNTEFPHLHLTIRKDGTELDPFAPEPATACGTVPPDTLWSAPLAYDPFGFTGAGFFTAVPEWDAIKAGLDSPATLPTDAPALVLWASYFGPRQGDELTLAITGPQGEVIRQTIPIDRTQAIAFRAVGKRTPQGGWPAGSYSGEIALTRNGVELGRQGVMLTVE
ncbi:M23 family metallopeptidase [Rhodobacteraceae bacterium HSP-20]|uniref:M23 family metallopeptidase n=1 Tax=Paragemmobacter amnigenus TaxID=2852097 RepID=A0ABS6J2V3_9RHOB|nr:M23 family metallopeptidase [Rhodobacter amnigenus]MBU9698091.1 M23 family metallopeptidase [Rhodobacter amnigenus]MBV4389318.1 M23 family metallopeptidase [Rhodobacter amnigenus]